MRGGGLLAAQRKLAFRMLLAQSVPVYSWKRSLATVSNGLTNGRCRSTTKLL